MNDPREIKQQGIVELKLAPPTAKEIDKLIESMASKKSACWEASHKAFMGLVIPIDQLKSDVLTEFLTEHNTGRWSYILLKGYQNLLNKNCIVGNGEWIRSIVDPDNSWIDSDSVVNEFKKNLWDYRHEFDNRMAEAKVILKSTIQHPHSVEIVDGYVKDWIDFSLGELPLMYDWEEIVETIRANDAGKVNTFRMIPRWLMCILMRENWEMDSLSQWPEIMPELFEPAIEEQPEPNVERMKGDGRRKLITKNGFTFPSPKRRW